MSKQTLVEEMMRRGAETELGSRANVDRAVDLVFESVRGAVVDQGRDVMIRGFGTFRLQERKGRSGRNPRTGEPIEIPATRKMAFKLPRGS